MNPIDAFQAMILREFLLEDRLKEECNISGILIRLGEIVRQPAALALEHFVRGKLGDFVAAGLTQLDIQRICNVKTATLVMRTVSDWIAWCKSSDDNYRSACRSALCYAVQGSFEWAFGALRGAASRNDTWSRHHHLYGLIHGAKGDFRRAMEELDRALATEPYLDARNRIQEARDIAQSPMALEGSPGQTALING
jgi:tetratricopeptide (TPR) repeat protein